MFVTSKQERREEGEELGEEGGGGREERGRVMTRSYTPTLSSRVPCNQRRPPTHVSEQFSIFLILPPECIPRTLQFTERDMIAIITSLQ